MGVSPLAANMAYQYRTNLTDISVMDRHISSISNGHRIIPASSLDSSPAFPPIDMESNSAQYVVLVTDPLTGAGLLTLAGTAAMGDGPLPIGDIIGAGILIGGLIIIWSQTPEEHIEDCENVIGELADLIAEGEAAIEEAIAENDWYTVDQIQGQIDEATQAIDDLWNRIIEVLDMYGPLG